MKASEVPQDNSEAYEGNKRAVYAATEDGTIGVVSSSGWDDEVAVTQQVIDDLNSLRDSAWENANQNIVSPLKFHMYDKRMDLQTLSQITGFFQWRIKRHFKPNVFLSLPDKTLQRYADALKMKIDEIAKLPKKDQD